MTLAAEYQRELQKTYIVGKSVPELIDAAQKLLEQIRDPDQFLPIRLDAFVMVARTLESSYAKFGLGRRTTEELVLIAEWIGRDKAKEAHACGPLCPEHGDPRDTNVGGGEFYVCPECGRASRYKFTCIGLGGTHPPVQVLDLKGVAP